MDIPLLLLFLGVVTAISVFLGCRVSSGIKTQEDYFLDGRRTEWLPLALTLLATQIGGATLLGAAEEAYFRGWIVLLYALGTCLGLLFLSSGYGARLRAFGISTLSELLERRYGSSRLRVVSACISIGALGLILVGMGIAARRFFVSIGCDSTWLFCAFWCAVVLYTVLGGLRAVMLTDVVQVLCIVGAFIIVVGVLWGQGTVSTEIAFSAPNVATGVPWSAWLCSPLLFALIEQDMGQRCFAAKSPKTVSKATAFAAIAMFLIAILPVYLGVEARRLGLESVVGGSILMTAVESLTNPLVTTLFAAALLMAIVSTADSLLCSISSNVSLDLLTASDQGMSSVRQAQWVTFAIGIATLAVAMVFNDVVSMLVFAYGLASSALVIPVLAAVYMKKASLQGAWIALGLGSACYLWMRVIDSTLPWELCSVLVSAFGYGAGIWRERSRFLAKTKETIS